MNELFSWRCTCGKSLQSCPTLCNPMDCSLQGSSVHGILHTRILEWAAISSSRGSSPPREQTREYYISCIGRQILYHWAQVRTALTLDPWPETPRPGLFAFWRTCFWPLLTPLTSTWWGVPGATCSPRTHTLFIDHILSSQNPRGLCAKILFLCNFLFCSSTVLKKITLPSPSMSSLLLIRTLHFFPHFLKLSFLFFWCGWFLNSIELVTILLLLCIFGFLATRHVGS